MDNEAKLDKILTAIARNRLAGFRKLVTPENANWQDEDGFTLAMNVVLDEDAGPDLLRHLIQCGADVNAADGRRKYTALHFAARDQRRDMVELLLKAGAAVDPLDIEGMTPLAHCALGMHPDLSLAALLLKLGANPKKKSKRGQSPLQIARFAEDEELVALLRAAVQPPARVRKQTKTKATAPRAAVSREKKTVQPSAKRKR